MTNGIENQRASRGVCLGLALYWSEELNLALGPSSPTTDSVRLAGLYSLSTQSCQLSTFQVDWRGCIHSDTVARTQTFQVITECSPFQGQARCSEHLDSPRCAQWWHTVTLCGNGTARRTGSLSRQPSDETDDVQGDLRWRFFSDAGELKSISGCSLTRSSRDELFERLAIRLIIAAHGYEISRCSSVSIEHEVP
jgi:hypothetical protein